MSPSRTVLKDQKGKVDRSALLGRLMWFEVSGETLIDHDEMSKTLTAAGFTKTLPPYPAEHDVFRRVTGEAERNRRPDPYFPDRKHNYMMRNVSYDDTEIVRRLVVEVVDPEGKKLDYVELADIVFRRDTKTVARRSIIDTYTYYPEGQEILDEIEDEYVRWRGKIGGVALRNWIRNTILAMGATAVKRGLYFLLERNADQVTALEELVSTLPGGNNCDSVEIPDNDKQRDMVRRSIEAETVGEIENKMKEIAEIRKSGKLTDDKEAKLLGEIAHIVAKNREYADLLHDDESRIEDSLELLHRMAKQLRAMPRGK